ncbi:MAG: hypothetical protein IJ783_03240 [Kiritimatiellae bacterium]|nr:hypothetical protein [Kiritimatiellia bacterium]
MTLRELQLLIRDKLNADKALMQGACKAFAEDALDARLAPEPALHAGAGGVALVVRTPGARLSGGGGGGLPLAATLAVDAIEVPAANRATAPFVSAMGAAERVAHLLHDGRTVTFDRFESDIMDSQEKRYYVFSAYFAANFIHTKPQD